MKEVKIFLSNGVFKDNAFWYFDNHLQSLCKISLKNYELNVVLQYDADEAFDARWFFCYKEKFYIVSAQKTDILIYDINKNNIELCKNYQKQSDENTIHFSIYCHGSICFIPFEINNRMICYDIFTGKYTEKFLLKKSIRDRFSINSIGKPFYNNGNIWFVIKNTPYYGKTSLESDDVNIYCTDNKKTLLDGICVYEEKVWLTQSDSGVIICSDGNNMEPFKEAAYSCIGCTKENIIILPRHHDSVIFINKYTNDKFIVTLPLSIEEKETINNIPSVLINFSETDNDIFLFSVCLSGLFVFHKNSKTVERVNAMTEDSDNLILKRQIKLNDIVYENESAGLKGFIECTLGEFK